MLTYQKPTHGRLVYRVPGKPEVVLEEQKPWGVLQNLKKQYAAAYYKSEYLKVTY